MIGPTELEQVRAIAAEFAAMERQIEALRLQLATVKMQISPFLTIEPDQPNGKG